MKIKEKIIEALENKKVKKKKNLYINICPNLLKDWKKNKIYNQEVQITKNEINLVSNQLSIFCNKDHNCFCDKRLSKNPKITLVGKGKEI